MAEFYAIAPDVSFRTVGGEIFILSRNDNVVFNLNVTGAFVWDGIHAGKSIDEIIGRMCDEFDADRDTVGRDTREIIGALVEKKLVNRCNA